MPKSSSKTVVAKKAQVSKKHTSEQDRGIKLSGANLTILNTAAALQVGKSSVSRKVFNSFVGGMLGKSTIANALTKHKNTGLMTVTPDTITVTELGMQYADIDAANVSIPKTNKELRDSIKEKFKLKDKEKQVLDVLGSKDGKHNKQMVKDKLGIKGTSTFANMLTKLKKLDIIHFDRTDMWLTSKMYLETSQE